MFAVRVVRMALVASALSLLAAGTAAAVDDAVDGNSAGNHDLGCRVVLPAGPQPADGYPVIVWSDGWYQGNVNGSDTTTGYLPGLRGWADQGYFIVAGTQWSARQSDTLRCLSWIADENADSSSAYHATIDLTKIGLAGHSQGGGAVLKAGDGDAGGKAKGPTQEIGTFTITSVIAMNPYGPSFGNPETIDGPVLFLGGSADTTTPTSSFLGAWESVQEGPGGVLAEYDGGTHNSEAWGDPTPELNDFGGFQAVTEAWWDEMFNGSGDPANVVGAFNPADWTILEVS